MDMIKRRILLPRIYSFARSHRMTLILISHDLESVREADHIFVLEQGQLIDQGSHAQLLAFRKQNLSEAFMKSCLFSYQFSFSKEGLFGSAEGSSESGLNEC